MCEIFHLKTPTPPKKRKKHLPKKFHGLKKYYSKEAWNYPREKNRDNQKGSGITTNPISQEQEGKFRDMGVIPS